MDPWLIYGANGYTGHLIAVEAQRRGQRPILAGRSREAIEALGRELDLPVRVFGLESASEIAAGLHGVRAVLHCAGPFSRTSRPLLDGCLAARAHYLDITGELSVFEAIFARRDEITRAGVAALPGVGFDVVPSDCLAALLARELPHSIRLRLGMRALGGGVSHGTALTASQNLHRGGCVRRDGRLVPVPAAYRTARIPFRADRAPQLAMTIPWGDVSTAFYSTGIPDIEFYLASSSAAVRGLKLLRYVAPLLANRPAQRLLGAYIKARVKGPTAAQREQGRSIVWGQVEDAAGKRVAARLLMPEGYALTVQTALAALERVLAGGVTAGPQTPSQAFGADFILGFAGVERQAVEPIAI